MPSNLRIEAAKASHGALQLENFRAVEAAIAPLRPGQILVENNFYTVDPAQARRFIAGYNVGAKIEDGELIRSFAVGLVVESRSVSFAEGDCVAHYGGWERYSVIDADNPTLPSFSLRKVDPSLPLSLHIGLLGNKGFSAYLSIQHFGRTRPGEAVLITGAAGAVGSFAGQFARLAGGTVVGVAGGKRKSRLLADDLGFDRGLDYRAADFEDQLDAALPDGIDVFLDNVGGPIQARAFDRMRFEGRAVICGMIADYQALTPPPGPNLFVTVNRGFSIQGFLANNYTRLFPEFLNRAGELLRQGHLQSHEDFVEGLLEAPAALLSVMAGENVGQRIVRVPRETRQ